MTFANALITYALARGAWRGLKQSLRRRRRPITTTYFDRVLREKYVAVLEEQLKQQPIRIHQGFTVVPFEEVRDVRLVGP